MAFFASRYVFNNTTFQSRLWSLLSLFLSTYRLKRSGVGKMMCRISAGNMRPPLVDSSREGFHSSGGGQTSLGGCPRGLLENASRPSVATTVHGSFAERCERHETRQAARKIQEWLISE
jgi:hypothetical protein